MIDKLILEFDQALRTVLADAPTVRTMPGQDIPDVALDEAERAHAAALMRVNHVGEVCAQALYRGQALACRTPQIRAALRQAAWEETEHLNWTQRRIAELGGRKSLLNPLWYAGSLAMGIVAGKLGDDWSLGFLAETERQVEAHLDGHLASLPAHDQRSRAVVDQMKADEIRHAQTALDLGARELPVPAKRVMATLAKFMTATAYHL